MMAALLSGCSWMVSSATGRFTGTISNAILNQNDPDTVREGAPAYLILIDGLIEDEPESEALLLTGARLNNAYAAVFVDETGRAQKLTDKAWSYSRRALCLAHPSQCKQYREPFAEYVNFLAMTDRSDVPVLYSFAASWANWIQAHQEDWNARADIPKVEATFRKVIELDETYLQGEPYEYLGVLSILLPPALGGKPDQARIYFERAIELSNGRNLMFKVVFAEHYGRMMFDRELHDRLLQEVLDADPNEPGRTLMNTIAQDKARKLIAGADDYF